MGITRPRPDGGVTRKAPGALDPAVFPFPSECKTHYAHSRYGAKWCQFMKLVIYRTFNVFPATLPLPASFLHPSPSDNMNP